MFQKFIDQIKDDFNAIKELMGEHITNNTTFVQTVAQNPVKATTEWVNKSVELNTAFTLNAVNNIKEKCEHSIAEMNTATTTAKKTNKKS